MKGDSMKVVVEWPTAKSVKELQSFLGFVNYNGDHISQFVTTATPLYELIQPEANFKRTERQQLPFQELIKAIVSALLLGFQNKDYPFILDTNASYTAIGAELIWIQNVEEKVIGYGTVLLPNNAIVVDSAHLLP